MTCGCSSRAERLLHRLGYRLHAGFWEMEARRGGPIQISAAELRQHHFRLTLFGVWKFLTLG